MKDDPPVVPPRPLRAPRSLGEIIAECPPQGLTWELSGRLGEIIAERIAGLPFEQRIDVAQQAIIEILITQTEVELTGLVRRHVALELARLWIPEKGAEEDLPATSAKICGEYTQASQSWRGRPRLGRKAGKPKPQKTRSEIVVADCGIHSVDALAQFLKRERRARKKPRP